MLEKLSAIEERYEELERLIIDPEVVMDYAKVAEYSKERSSLSEIVDSFRLYRQQLAELEDAKQMLIEETDSELSAMAKDEIDALTTSTEKLLEDLKIMLLPKDPRDDKNVIVEIRAGPGGDEAGLFTADLFRMYSYYAQNRGWKIKSSIKATRVLVDLSKSHSKSRGRAHIAA